MCKWVLLPDRKNPNARFCDRPGEPYCPEHDVELHYHTWLDLRDYVDRYRREEAAEKVGKLTILQMEHRPYGQERKGKPRSNVELKTEFSEERNEHTD